MQRLPNIHENALAQCCNYIDANQATANFGSTVSRFIPLIIIDEIASEQNINDVLWLDNSFNLKGMEERRDLRQQIRYHGIRCFTIAIYSKIPMYSLQKILKIFNDNHLPLRLNQTPSRNLRTDFKTFVDNQDRFVAPCFRSDHFDAEFTNCSIPIQFKDSNPELGRGVAGKVYSARIYKGHYRFPGLTPQPTNSWSQEFALKVIRRDKDAKRERHFLTFMATQRIRHAHITKFYTGFHVAESTYLLAELAGGDLNRFMEEYPAGKRTPRMDRDWFVSQLRGLAGALEAIHGPKGGYSAYVHDIKPANILFFNDADVKYRLKFTDWGCANTKQYQAVQPQGSGGTTKQGNPGYLPPETEGDQPSSRPHDIWSLGCVYLGLLIWYVDGWNALKMFREGRLTESDDYYTIQGRGKALVDIAQQELKSHGQMEKGTWGLLVDIIRKMLDINPRTRIRAGTLARELEQV